VTQYPFLEEEMEKEILPKKQSLYIATCDNGMTIIADQNQKPVFFQYKEGPYFPHLKILHQCLLFFSINPFF